MIQQPVGQKYTDERVREKLAHPKRFDVFFHAIKTFKLIGSLMVDGRVPVVRKLLFVGSIAALAVFLFFPDLISEAFLSTVLPVVGTVLGVPLDAGFDWAAFALVVVSLLRYFPADIVSEHYRSIFDR
ncbi:MAG: hypothetical protein H0U76_29790 [Ktedonobacteraceae bacterium]|nr:hypothetical protein [Ktedonobacteraceae bacterium]